MTMKLNHKRSHSNVVYSVMFTFYLMILASCSTTQLEQSTRIEDSIALEDSTKPSKIWSKQSLQLFSKAHAEISTNPNAAISDFKKVITLEPKMEAAYFNLMRLYLEQDFDQDDAAAENKQLIASVEKLAQKENILSARMLNLIAIEQRKTGAFNEAEQSLSRALMIEPVHLSVLANMAILQDLYLHDLKTALNYYEQYQQQLVLQDKQDSRLVNWLADIRLRIQKQERNRS